MVDENTRREHREWGHITVPTAQDVENSKIQRQNDLRDHLRKNAEEEKHVLLSAPYNPKSRKRYEVRCIEQIDGSLKYWGYSEIISPEERAEKIAAGWTESIWI